MNPQSTLTTSALPAASRQAPAIARSSPRLLLLVLIPLLVVALMAGKPKLTGDFLEYVLMTTAVASHGSADIRPDDIARARALMPSEQGQLAALETNMRDASKAEPIRGFYRGLNGKTYAIHFPGYSALAVAPFKLFQWIGISSLKCYKAVNLAMVLVLGMALLRLLGSVARALAGVALYTLCGGLLYWGWTGPECLSAAALLAGFSYYCSGAQLRGGLLVGLAAMQNSSIVLTLGALPVLAWCLQPGMALHDGVRAALRPRSVAGLLLGGVLAGLPILFNLEKFGNPSIIAKISTGTDLISVGRLHSLYFDLNQGMMLAIPAATVMLLAWNWRGMTVAERRSHVLALLLCVLLTLGYAIPAMTLHNWNSGAQGVMRYAFWSAMPFVFLLLWRLRSAARWPRAWLGVVLIAQAAAMGLASSYKTVEFSPLAKLVLQWAPGLYHPEPEIFAERSAGHEDADSSKVYIFRHGGIIQKALYHYNNPNPGAGLCAAGQTLMGEGRVVRSHEWIYVDGPVRCTAYTGIGAGQFNAGTAVTTGDGWSVLEQGGGRPTGMWSVGDQSQLQVALAHPGKYTRLVIRGFYFDGNVRTRVIVNGTDMGWADLQAGEPVAIPHAATSLQVELRHESPRSPGPQDGRKLAIFLLNVSLQ